MHSAELSSDKRVRLIDHYTTLPANAPSTLRPLQRKPEVFLNKSIIIYGKTGSGKTVTIKNIIKILSPVIDTPIVICPTEPSNQLYSGIFPASCIHHDLYRLADKDEKNKEELLFNSFWEYQSARAKRYAEAININLLERVIERLKELADSATSKKIDRAISNKLSLCDQRKQELKKEYHHHPNRKDILPAKWDELEKIKEKILINTYRRLIYHHRDLFTSTGSLGTEEQNCILYSHKPPRMLLVLDDCAAQLKSIQGKDVFKKIFFQGRHIGLTLILSCQDDTSLSPEFRRNATVSFYTYASAFIVNNTRKTDGKSTESKTIKSIADLVYSEPWRQVVYLADVHFSNPFFWVKFNEVGRFKIGDSKLWLNEV